MKKFWKKIIKVIMIHVLWEGFILNASLNCDSFNHTISSISFFLIEPINVFIVYPMLVYIIIYRIIRKEPYDVRNEKRTLLIFSLICTLISMSWLIEYHIERYIEEGFSLLIYGDYWLY